MYRGSDVSDVPGLPFTEYSDNPYDDLVVCISIYLGSFRGEPEYSYLNLNHTGYLCDDIELPPGMNPDCILEDILSGAIFSWGGPEHRVDRVQLYMPPTVSSAIEVLRHIEGAPETEFGQMVLYLDCCGGYIARDR